MGDRRGVPQHPPDVDRLEHRTRYTSSRVSSSRRANPISRTSTAPRPLPPSPARSNSTLHELALAGHDPLPVYAPIEAPPQGYYRLLYGRHPVHTFAKTQNTPLLNELYPENELWLNADAAAAQGLRMANTSGWRTRTAPAAAPSRSRLPSVSARTPSLWPTVLANSRRSDPGQGQRSQRHATPDALCARSDQRRRRYARQLCAHCEGGIAWRPTLFCSTLPAVSAARPAWQPAKRAMNCRPAHSISI